MVTAQIQETGRYALETLKPVLRGAGANGFCAGELPIKSHLNTTCPAWVDNLYDAGRVLTGWELDGTGASETYTMATLSPTGVNVNKWDSLQPDTSKLTLPAALSGNVVPGTDVLVLRTLEPVPNLTAQGNTTANAAAINLTGKHCTDGDTILLVTNCTDAADLFQNTTNGNADSIGRGKGSCTNPGPGNIEPSGSWSTQYDNRMQQAPRATPMAAQAARSHRRPAPATPTPRSTRSRTTAPTRWPTSRCITGSATCAPMSPTACRRLSSIPPSGSTW